MPEFYIKKGLADVELKEWIKEHADEPFVRVNIEVESSHDRLRRSFHVLTRHWFDSGEWSCNGSDIRSLYKLRLYYKLEGCEAKPDKYIYNNDEFSCVDELVVAYPDFDVTNVGRRKSWTKMNKKQKSLALNILLTEIKLSMTNNQKVLEWVAKITGDIDMLNDINYYKNIGE